MTSTELRRLHTFFKALQSLARSHSDGLTWDANEEAGSSE